MDSNLYMAKGNTGPHEERKIKISGPTNRANYYLYHPLNSNVFTYTHKSTGKIIDSSLIDRHYRM